MNRFENLCVAQPDVEKHVPLYVMKFGGSSLGNAESIDSVVDFLSYHRQDGRRVVVVASAMKGVTEQLSLATTMLQYSPSEAERYLWNVRTQYQGVIEDLRVSEPTRLSLKGEFASQYAELEGFMQNVGSVTPIIRDEILAYGERFIVPIVSGVLQERGIDATPIDARDVIVTDDQFGEAVVFVDQTRTDEITSLLQKGVIPVVTGFSGRTKDGRTTTLGRNSSDLTAAILGERLDAQEVWICKDVLGLYNNHGDVIPEVKYSEFFSVPGSTQVVHPVAISLMRETIPMRVKCTSDPIASGTVIFEASQLRDQRV